MWRSWTSGRLTIAMLMFCAALTGCTNMNKSCLDPSGDRVFAAPARPVSADRSQERYFDDPQGPLPWDDVGVDLHPRETVAAVGSEVVLIAGVCGPDGYLRTNRRLEWSIDPGSVGQFVAVGETGFVDLLVGDFNRPRKITNTFAIGSTLRTNTRLNRGTCNPETNAWVLRGEGWISLTSAAEGVSHVTVFAPEVYTWDARLKSAIVHWVDAQWRFPSPAIQPMGGKHVFSTSVTRQTNQSPCEHWRVRYEITGGPPAGFVPDGAQSIEIPTDPTGKASVEIFQKDPKPGTNKICIQVIRPGDVAGANGQRLVVGTGTTMMTWTGPSAPAVVAPTTTSPSSLRVQIAGPSQATVGMDVKYTITVTNLGQSAATDLIIKDRLDPGFQNPAVNQNNAIERVLGNLAPGASQQVNVTLKATKAGKLCHTVEVTGQGGASGSAKACLTAVDAGGSTGPSMPPFGGTEQPKTNVPAAKSSIGVKVTGPAQLSVGETARFNIEVTNTGTTALQNVRVFDRYDENLLPTMATDGYRVEGSGLAWTIDNLPPNKTTQLGIHCTCQSATMKACNRVTVSTASGDKFEGEACLEIRAPVTKPPENTTPPPAKSGLTMSVVGLRNPVVAGKELTYEIVVTNSGTTPCSQVRLTVTIPEGMLPNPIGTVGPGPTKFTRDGNVIQYDPVLEVKPGESLMYRVRVLAKKAGQYKLRADLTSPALPQPLTQEAKPTEVF